MNTQRRAPVTPSEVTATPADTPIGPPGQNDDDRLDEAIQETFPASDPISLRIEETEPRLAPD
jgi:hypothetical protein